MSLTVAELTGADNALAPHYSRFRVAERLLLTGHSHQAWPDAAAEGQMRAIELAADLVDDKWEVAFGAAERVRAGWRGWMGGCDGDLVLGPNTHELLLRLLSALALTERPRVITTDGEFHSARRQLDRLAEAGLELVTVAATPADAVAERLAAQVDSRTCLVLVSTVQFGTGHRVPDLARVAAACHKHGAELVLDAYHSLGVLPFSLVGGLESAWVLGGGYKYCQLGEGNGVLRVPPQAAQLRPLITGWFAEFDRLTDPGQGVAYPEGPNRWAGATYDPTAHLRAEAVMDFHQQVGLTIELAHQVNRAQLARMEGAFDDLGLDPALVDRDRRVPRDDRGGFLALRSPRAADLRDGLAQRGVHCDHRGDVVRLGPAPYLSGTQLDQAIDLLGESARELG